MSAVAEENTTVGVPTIPVDLIDVSKDHNPRRRFDEHELSELCQSIEQHGVVQAITVVAAEGGRYDLIAGERRLRAAKAVGITDIPALVRASGAELGAAVAENLTRADLDVIEEADAIRRLAEIEKLDQTKVAERVGKSRSWVSERFRLLKLPAGCQQAFADGHLPLAAEKPLQELAKVSEEVADCVAAWAVEFDGDEVARDIGGVLEKIARLPGDPTLITLAYGQLDASLIDDAEERAKLAERCASAQKRMGLYVNEPEEASVRVGEDQVDAARAAGVLIEIEPQREYGRGHYFLTDREFAADLVRRGVDDLEHRASQLQEQKATQAAERGEGAPVDPTDTDAVADQRKEEREQKEKERGRAENHNHKLGKVLLERRGGGSRKKHSLARAKALASVVVAAEPKLAARGLRYVLPQLRKVETKELKSGEERSKLVLADEHECREYLERKISEAKTPQEVLELMADAMIAAECADQREVAMTHQVQWWNNSISGVVKDGLISADAKEVGAKRPRS